MDCPRCGQLSKRCSGRVRSEPAPAPAPREDDASASSDYVRQARPKGRRCKQVVCRRCPQGCRDAGCSEFEKVAPRLSSLLRPTRRPRPTTTLSRPPRTALALDATGRIKDLHPRRRITREHSLAVTTECASARLEGPDPAAVNEPKAKLSALSSHSLPDARTIRSERTWCDSHRLNHSTPSTSAVFPGTVHTRRSRPVRWALICDPWARPSKGRPSCRPGRGPPPLPSRRRGSLGCADRAKRTN